MLVRYSNQLRRIAAYAGLLVSMMAFVRPLIAQTCLAPDSATTAIRDKLVSFVTATDSETVRDRNAVGLPQLTASDVNLSVDSTVCASASTALATLTADGDPALGAWVFEMGPSRYVAYNYRQRAHGSLYVIVYDRQFNKLGNFML